MQVITERIETTAFRLLVLPDGFPLRLQGLFRRFPHRRRSVPCMIGTAVIGDHKHVREFLRGITDRDPVKPRCEIDSVPVRLAAETMEPSSIKLHAWVPVIVERADSHSGPVHMDAGGFCGLPCSDRSPHCVKNIFRFHHLLT